MTEKKKNTQLRPCKACSKEVAIKARKCPHCGVDNPGITWKDYLLAFGLLLVVAVTISYCVAEPEERPARETETSTIKAEPPPPATLEELKAAYETSTGRASIIKTLRIMVEPMIAVPNRTQITQELLDAKTACKNLSYQASIEETPQTDPELADLYRDMNSALSFAAGAICNRINAAIELSSGTKKPVKAAEKFEQAGQWYAHEWMKYEKNSGVLADRLTELDTTSVP